MKALLISIFLILQLFGKEPYSTTIKTINGDIATLQNKDLKVGESGIIIQEFKDNYSYIVSSASVVKVDKDIATIKLSKFNNLKQEALPVAKLYPKVGDTVLINNFSNNGVIIAPNKKIYNQVLKHKNNIEWINSDIIAGELMIKGSVKLTKEFINDICNKYSIGIIYFALEKGYITDCKSLKVLETDLEFNKSDDIISPLYSRIGKFEANVLNFDGKIDNFYKYYNNLITK